jgi:hypothetical protein
MGYVGNQQAEGFVQRPTKQDLTGATGDTLTLTHAVSKEEDIDLYINNVKQEPTTAYTVADTAVTLTGDVVASDDIYVVYNSLALQTVVPPDGSVTSAKLASGAVTSAKLDTNIAVTGTLTTSGTLDVNSTLDVSSSNFKMTDLNSNAFYRTGTFTPAFSSTAATDLDASIVTQYDAQVGHYTRIGDLVHIEVTIITDSVAWTYTNGGAAVQNLTVVGLPFTIKNVTNYYPSISVGSFGSWNSWGGGYTPMGYGVTNTKRINATLASTNGTDAIPVTSISAIGSSIVFSMTYETDDA